MVMDPYRLGEWVTIHRALRGADGGPPQVGYEMERQVICAECARRHWRLAQCKPCRLAVWEGRGPARSRAPRRIRAARRGRRHALRLSQ